MRSKIILVVIVISSIALTASIVNAAGMSFEWLRIGAQDVGGVTFFNGTVVNETTDSEGNDNPVVFGDNVRIDGRVWRGATSGTGDNMPFIVNDNMEVVGTLTVGGGSVTTDSTAATLTADWINTDFPWSANEIADITRRVPIPLAGLYTDADGTPAAITSTTTPSLNYTANQGLFLQYAEDDVIDFGGQIVVPNDYVSGGVFKLVVDTAGAIVTDWNLDWQIAISATSGTAAWATAMTDETPVDISDNAGTPDVITFTPTLQSEISAGDVIYFDIWPDTNTATGEPNVEIYSVWFEYTATQ